MEKIKINQNVAILCDGNNIELSIHSETNNKNAMINFDKLIPKLLNDRGLNRLIYFREGVSISDKFAERLHANYYGSVIPCHKTADIPLSIKATQLASKVDTIIIMSGDSDYIELVRHLKAEGVRVEIAAVKSTTSAYLIKEADHFHPIVKEDWFIYGNHKPYNNNRNNSYSKQKQFDKSNKPVASNNVSSKPNVTPAIIDKKPASLPDLSENKKTTETVKSFEKPLIKINTSDNSDIKLKRVKSSVSEKKPEKKKLSLIPKITKKKSVDKKKVDKKK